MSTTITILLCCKMYGVRAARICKNGKNAMVLSATMRRNGEARFLSVPCGAICRLRKIALHWPDMILERKLGAG